MSTNLQLRMITYSALIALLCVSLSYIYQSRADANSLLAQSDSIRIVRIHLQGWQDGKIQYAQQRLQRIPGVVEVKFEPSARRAIIWLDVDRTNLRTIEKALHQAGFTASYQ